MKTKTALCLTILVMLLCTVNMIMVWQLTHVKESRTVELTATMTGFDDKNALVYVTRPEGVLYLPDVLQDSLTTADMEPLVGRQVHFRMKESAAQFYRQEQYGDIVALGTDEQEVFTLDDYNRAMQADNAQGWPVWLMIEGGLLVLLVYFAWKLKREKAASAHRA